MEDEKIFLDNTDEVKYADNVDTNSAIVPTGTIVLLNGLNLGTTASERIGRNIQIIRISVRINLKNTSALSSTARIMLIYDEQPNQQTFTMNNLLENSTSGFQVISHLNVNNIARFQVLYDEEQPLVPGSSTQEIFLDNVVETNIIPVYSNTNNGDIQDINTGALFLVYTSNQTSMGDEPLIDYHSRVYYFDK